MVLKTLLAATVYNPMSLVMGMCALNTYHETADTYYNMVGAAFCVDRRRAEIYRIAIFVNYEEEEE